MNRQRVKIIFKYDGSKFCGFQRQKNGRSVQKEIEVALEKIYGKEILIKGAGRTDAGVHANGQVAHFDLNEWDKNITLKLNNVLNDDIYILKAERVNNDFHARKDAILKEYIYKINIGPFRAFYNCYIFQPQFKLDIKLMKDASKEFLGTHDFKNFVAGFRDDYTATIKSIDFKKRGNIIEIHFKGTGFYRYMVRNMVGALIEVGRCRIYKSTIKSMLDFPNKEKNLPTALPEGLYLQKIWYK